ncbi:MAG: M3 family metallopeptidase [Polyangiaceae bacterium]
MGRGARRRRLLAIQPRRRAQRRVGAAFRERVLSRGSSQDPKELFVGFMGREPDPEALFARSGLL